MSHAGDAARDRALVDDQMAFLGQWHRRSKFYTHELLSRPARLEDRQAALSYEEGFLHRHRPHGVRLVRVRQPVGILTDDEMALFQAQHALRFHTERAYGPRPAGRQPRLPDLGSPAGRNADFISQLTHATDA